MPDFTPEPLDPIVPDPIPAPDPVVHSRVDVDALLAAHAAFLRCCQTEVFYLLRSHTATVARLRPQQGLVDLVQ